jgi:holliday junction DNA helicase RuvA
MIAFIDGTILEKHPDHVVVKTGGLGYLIEIPLTTFLALPSVGEAVQLHLFTLVREDAIRLFGFKNQSEKQIFQMFLGISRIGPKLALNILSGIEMDALKRAIVQQDVKTLSGIPGIGKKSAERILFEIKEKVDQLEDSIPSTALAGARERKSLADEVISVLLNLGYKKTDADSIVQKVIAEEPTEATLQSIIRKSLRVASGRKTE